MAEGCCLQASFCCPSVAHPHTQARPSSNKLSQRRHTGFPKQIRRQVRLGSFKTALQRVCWGGHLRAVKEVFQAFPRKLSVRSSWDNSSNDGEEDDELRWSAWSPRDEFGLYPWDPSWQAPDNSDLEWIQDDIITLLTTDGLIRIGGSHLRPHPSSSKRRQAQLRALSRQRRYREEDYMDPKQGLCLGAIFDIAATNVRVGLDTGRRFCVFGFCRSIEMLNDVVQNTVLEQGGEVVVAEKESTGGLNEKLTMTVAMPLLWGVPPAVDTLHYAIRSGGGIVEKTYRQWEFL